MRITRLSVLVSTACATMLSFASAAAHTTERIVDMAVLFVLSAFQWSPSRFDLVPAPAAAAVLGLPQTRAFARRRADRPDSRSRAPDSMAFVTA